MTCIAFRVGLIGSLTSCVVSSKKLNVVDAYRKLFHEVSLTFLIIKKNRRKNEKMYGKSNFTFHCNSKKNNYRDKKYSPILILIITRHNVIFDTFCGYFKLFGIFELKFCFGLSLN